MPMFLRRMEQFFRWIPVLTCVCTALYGFAPEANAQAYPQVDVSVSVCTSPIPFVPGGSGIVALTVHNEGPDAAGNAEISPFSIDVIQQAFIVTSHPPPYRITDSVSGCFIMETITEPLPDGNIALVWEFYFDVIASGESRTCTFGIEFYPGTRETFTTSWFASPGYHEDDLNLTNNRANYTFTAPAAFVPTSSWHALVAMSVGFLVMAFIFQRKSSCVEARTDHAGHRSAAYGPARTEPTGS